MKPCTFCMKTCHNIYSVYVCIIYACLNICINFILLLLFSLSFVIIFLSLKKFNEKMCLLVYLYACFHTLFSYQSLLSVLSRQLLYRWNCIFFKGARCMNFPLLMRWSELVWLTPVILLSIYNVTILFLKFMTGTHIYDSFWLAWQWPNKLPP